eukprot:scaffold735_cov376-Prasinococcus_capsulatus_cf.AAC.10
MRAAAGAPPGSWSSFPQQRRRAVRHRAIARRPSERRLQVSARLLSRSRGGCEEGRSWSARAPQPSSAGADAPVAANMRAAVSVAAILGEHTLLRKPGPEAPPPSRASTLRSTPRARPAAALINARGASHAAAARWRPPPRITVRTAPAVARYASR